MLRCTTASARLEADGPAAGRGPDQNRFHDRADQEGREAVRQRVLDADAGRKPARAQGENEQVGGEQEGDPGGGGPDLRMVEQKTTRAAANGKANR